MIDWIVQIMHTIGVYAVPIVLILAEIFFALFLINTYWKLNHRKSKHQEEKQGESLYQRAVGEGTQQLQVLIRHQDQDVVFISDNIQDIFGIEKGQLQYNPAWLETIFGKVLARRLIKSYLSWDRANILKEEFYYENGKRWMSLEVKPVLQKEYDFLVIRDVTGDRESIQKLEERIQQVELENESKTSFLYRMSHEIRTPMNGIIGMLTLAEKSSQIRPEVEVYLEKASDLSQYLLSLINDILDMSRIEAGKIEISEDIIDIENIFAQLNDMFRKTIEAKGVEYILEKQDMDVRYVIGDELRLMQVIVNFLSNAVKFTSQGEIRVSFRQMYLTDSDVNIMINVKDTGKGMDPKFIDRIFHPFEQENNDIQKKYGGTGLGMAITDQIVRLMGGEIVIDSMPDKGTNISVYLKLGLPDQEAVREYEERKEPGRETVEETATLEGCNILLVEDNEINAEIAVSILEMEGTSIDWAENGQLAVERFESSEQGHYDVILMDVHMPVMDGLEATRVIRAMDREDARNVLIIALSADAFVEDRRRALEAGMNEHIAKPIDFGLLKEVIVRFLSERSK